MRDSAFLTCVREAGIVHRGVSCRVGVGKVSEPEARLIFRSACSKSGDGWQHKSKGNPSAGSANYSTFVEALKRVAARMLPSVPHVQLPPPLPHAPAAGRRVRVTRRPAA